MRAAWHCMGRHKTSTTQLPRIQVHHSNGFFMWYFVSLPPSNPPEFLQAQKPCKVNGAGSKGSGLLLLYSWINRSSSLISYFGVWMPPRNTSINVLPICVLQIKTPTCFSATNCPLLPLIQANQAVGQGARSNSTALPNQFIWRITGPSTG